MQSTKEKAKAEAVPLRIDLVRVKRADFVYVSAALDALDHRLALALVVLLFLKVCLRHPSTCYILFGMR